MLKVSRETMCWQKQTMFFTAEQESFTWNIRQFAWKTGEQTFLCYNFEEKTSFKHDFGTVGGVFNDISDILQNFAFFYLFGWYVDCFLR